MTGRASFVDAVTGPAVAAAGRLRPGDSGAHRRLPERRLRAHAVLLELRRFPPPRLGRRRPARSYEQTRSGCFIRSGAARASAMPMCRRRRRSAQFRLVGAHRPRRRVRYDERAPRILPAGFLPLAGGDRPRRHEQPGHRHRLPAIGKQPVMLLAERGSVRNLGPAAENAFATPHEARVLRFELSDEGVWDRSDATTSASTTARTKARPICAPILRAGPHSA